jgi:hypothetical protein
MATPYEIEDGIDFFAELESPSPGSQDEGPLTGQCLLTGTPLDGNHVVLECTHAFNYPAIFNEVAAQKAHQSSYGQDTVRLSLGELKCPYCRHVNAELLPYRPLPGNSWRVRGVNAPENLCMRAQSCAWRLRGGVSKGLVCGEPAYTDHIGTYCPRHRKTVRLGRASCEIDSLTVNELKQRLREQNLPVSGPKSALIARLKAHRSASGTAPPNVPTTL